MNRILVGCSMAAALLLSGCGAGLPVETGPMIHDTASVPMGKVERMTVELHMGAGEMNVKGGSSELMQGEFDYNVKAWKPVVNYDATGFRGRLDVRQGGGNGSIGNVKNTWSIALTDKIPMELRVHTGAGELNLDLRETELRDVEVHLGAGEVNMDLRNSPKHDYDVRVNGGVGQANIIVPMDVGVIAQASGGLGSIKVHGMEKEGGRWVTAANKDAKTTIRVNVKGGIGEIVIRAE